MKKTIQFLIAILYLPILMAQGPMLVLQETVQPVNAVIGDISFENKFGRLPNANDDEQLRIQTHLAYVEQLLHNKTITHLSEAQQRQRTHLLDLLKDYYQAGVFPTNYEFRGERKPVFNDQDNKVCAVGYLIQQTEGQNLVDEINTKFKHAYIWEIENQNLNNWVVNSGLSGEECAMIQPAYILPDDRPRRPRPIPGMFSLELRRNQIHTKITDQSATTSLDQTFYNPTNNQLQGYYFYPIPKDATVDHFSMFINGVETQGEILDAAKARKIYEDIVRKAQDPALLEYYNNGLFRVRIFPIQPRSEQRVKLTYTNSLQKENGTIEYVLPFKQVDEASSVNNNVSFKIDIETTDKSLKTIYCPTHEVEINRKGDQNATIGFEAANYTSPSDFKLYFNTANSKLGISMLDYKDGSEDGYFFLNISPGFADDIKVLDKDITFVLDASGSMAGKKMEQAKKALNFCITNLNKGDNFNIIRFSTEATPLFSQLETANNENRKKANAYIDDLRPIGGTNIDEALELALKHKSKNGKPHFVIFMTDGKPTIGETDEKTLLAKVKKYNAENTRIFTFGIGTQLNTHLLDKLTEMTKAYRTYVLPNEDIEIKVSDFYTKVASPVLTDLKIEFKGGPRTSEIYPKELPDLFKGSTLSLLGRYDKAGKSQLILTGMVNGKKETLDYDISFAKENKDNSFIPSLWAVRAVGYLLDQVRLHGENAEVVTEIVRLSKKHGIITPYTSYLIIEDERNSLSMGRIRQEDAWISNRTMSAAPQFEAEIEEDYDNSMNQNSGSGSVAASAKVQSMSSSQNIVKEKADKKLEYKDSAGNTKSLAGDIKNIQGRALFKENNQWLDTNLQLSQNQNLKVNRIAFNSVDFFKLMNDNPEANEFLALGRNVKFVLDGNVYEIYE